MKKVGIMGGTFDPIHIGHLMLGEKAYEQFALDEVLFMPSGNPPHKQNRNGGASDRQRVEMVRLAIASNSHFTLSLEEMHPSGYVYTSDTLTRLTQEHPDTTYYFIMGADSLLSFDSWHEPQIICDHCIILAAVRDHLPQARLDEEIERTASYYHADIRKLGAPNMDVSSSGLRKAFADGASCRYYIPDPVLDYMHKEQIYLK